MRSYSKVAWFITIGMALLFLDFFSKAYVMSIVPFQNFGSAQTGVHAPVFAHLFGGIDFSITLATNRGAAWGLFADFQFLLIGVRVCVILGMLVYLFFLNSSPRLTFPLVLIISGAIGNVVDFFLYGYVIDFLSFHFWGYAFPIFNFADTCISIGVIWLFLVALTRKSRELSRHQKSS